MRIDADFDSAAVLVESEAELRFALRDDNAAAFRHWFYYQLESAAGAPLAMRVDNAGASSYPGGWGGGYRAVASYDGDAWFRVPTRYEGGALVLDHAPDRDLVGYACFAPYPYERHQRLVSWAGFSPRVRVVSLGDSVEGRPLPALVLGNPRGRRVWMIARQHPGETMAEWFVEGVVGRLLDERDPVIEALLGEAALVVVPNMNPDGSFRGNHRTNAAGCDLNRAWTDPHEALTPEVFQVRRAMLEGGVDLFLDIHGEETLPYVFGAGAEGIPSYSDRLDTLERRFKDTLAGLDPDFQVEQGYPRDAPDQADLRIAGNWAAEQFDCLSITLEMPFKDNAFAPDEAEGWSPERSRRLGRNTLEAVLRVLPEVR